MMLARRWNTLDEVAAYLKERTGEVWTVSAVLERIAELQPASITITPPLGTPMLKLDGGEWTAWDYCDPMLFEVGDVDFCVQQWVLSGSARIHQMLIAEKAVIGRDRVIHRFRPSVPIPIDSVRLNLDDVDRLPTAFHRLLEELEAGKHPQVRAGIGALDTQCAAESGGALEVSDASSDVSPDNDRAAASASAPFVNVDPELDRRKVREDPMTLLLIEVITGMRRRDERVTAGTVMDELRKLEGKSCVVDQKAEGVIWEATTGERSLLKGRALHKRIKRLEVKGI